MNGQSLQSADGAASGESPARAVGASAESCPFKRLAIEVLVVDEDDAQPLAGVGVELRNEERGAVAARTLHDGTVRFDGLRQEAHSVSLYEIDAACWSITATESLPEDRATSHGDAAWGAASAVDRAARTHVVAQGECLLKLADRYGLLPDALTSHPANKALSAGGRSLGILAPGDKVMIPARTDGAVSVEVGQRITVSQKTVAATLNLRFLDGEEKPRGGIPYLLGIETLDGRVLPDRAGKTDEDGAICERVPASTSYAEVRLGEGTAMEVYEIDVGFVDPIQSVSGVQERLDDLGYGCGDDQPGQLGPGTKEALAAFQEDHELDATGEIDDATRKKLQELFLT